MSMEVQADYAVKTLDFETYLVGAVTDKIIDADRDVRSEWANGFPNWVLYRTVFAGDTHLKARLRDWCVAYGIAHAEAGGVRSGLPVDEIGCLAGWDAYYALLNHKWLIAGQDVADVAGVDPKTYRKVRNHVFKHCQASLGEYWVRMQVAVRQVWMRDRWIQDSPPPMQMTSGRGFGELGHVGSGCFRANPLPTSGGAGVYSDDMKEAGL